MEGPSRSLLWEGNPFAAPSSAPFSITSPSTPASTCPCRLSELPALRGSIWDCVHSWNINAKLCLLWRMLNPSQTKDHPPLAWKGLNHRGPLSFGWVPCMAYHGGVWQGCCSVMLGHMAKVLAVLPDLRMSLLTLPCPSLLIYKCKLWY